MFLEQILKVVENAKQGIESLVPIVKSKEFEKTIDAIFYTRGKVIISGVGKSGNIGRKMASTMASFGIKAIFLDPTDASHGELGALGQGDTALLLSKSGASIELENIIKYARTEKIPIISFTMEKDSFLAKESDISLVLEKIQDGFGEIDMAPMSSMTTMLALGDAIAAGVAIKKDFSRDKYKIYHPGGKIGKSITKLKYIMRKEPDQMPLLDASATLQDVIIEISQKMLGTAGVMENGVLIGIITDGDLRRYVMKNGLKEVSAIEIATKKFKYLIPNMFADEAIIFLTNNKITSSFVLDEEKKPCGIVNIHDLLI